MRVAVGSHPDMMRVNWTRRLMERRFQAERMLGRWIVVEVVGKVVGFRW